MTTESIDWQPGDPLHSWSGVYVRPMFQIVEADVTAAFFADAASWPTPRSCHDLDVA